MSIEITESQLTTVIENFGQEAVHKAQLETKAVFPGGWMPPSVILALGLRETGLQNIRGGAVMINGHWVPSYTDVGWLQINSLISTNEDWLRGRPGCPDGSWRPDMIGWHLFRRVTAFTDMHNPTFTAALQYTLAQMAQERAEAYAAKVAPADVMRFVIAAHNAGFGGALRGYCCGDVDRYSTMGDYSEWVLHYAPMIAAWIEARPSWQA